MNPSERSGTDEEEIYFLASLAAELRDAIRDSLVHGLSQHAVALDTARDFLETVLTEESPTSTRLGIARARAELALEVWRNARDVRH